MKKFTLTALVLCLAIILIAACSSNNNGGGSTTTPPKSTTPSSSTNTPSNTDPADDGKKSPYEGTTLTMLTQNHPAWPFNPDWLVWDAFEHYTGIALDVNGYQGDWWEAIPLTIASGDMPDIMWMNGGSNVWKYGNEGALVNLLDHIDKMPHLQKVMEERPQDVAAALSSDGKLYSSPMRSVGGSAAIHQVIFLHREDIFKKHNIELPKTTDDFIEVLRELKRLYPDSYPYLPNPGLANIRSSAPSWGTDWGAYIKDGEPAYGFIEDNFKQMLEFFNLLYSEGLMHPELLTMDTNQRQALIANNQAFVIHSYQNQIHTLQELVRPEYPDFTLAFMPPPETPVGLAYLGGGLQPGVGGWTIPVTANLDAALYLLDWTLSDEGQIAMNFGIEGETFEYVDGEPRYTQEIIEMGSTERNKKYGLTTSGANHNSSMAADMQLLTEQAQYAVEQAQKYLGPIQQPQVAMTPEETEFRSIQGEAINTHAEENISKFIIGTRPFSEWDQFVEEQKALNIDKLVEDYYNAYLRTQQ